MMFRHGVTEARSSPENSYNNSRNVYTTPIRSSLRRYSLAETWHPTPTTPQKKIDNEVHFSTKMDGDSPGYSTRVVKYNSEQEKLLPTHRCKYDKLGVFPIVHFFKNELPFLKRKSVKGSASLSASDTAKFNSPDQNRLLLESIIKSNPLNQETVPHNNESNTKSVLDALKEISGKRIHTDGDEFILKEDGKRMYAHYDSENNLSKRVKQNSQLEDHPRTSPIRISASLNELMASCSSMDGYLDEKSKKRRLNVPATTPVKSFTPAKYVDVETQTTESQTSITFETVPNSKELNKEDVAQSKTTREHKVKKVSPVKVFDETPLEIMRKNRLTALMGSLNANKQQSKTEPSTQQSPNKHLVSILAGNTKNHPKSVKHVSFNLPEVVNSTDDRSNTNSLSASNGFLNMKPEADVTKTSTAISSPIVSASVTDSISPQSGSVNNNLPPLQNSSKELAERKQSNSNSEVHSQAPLSSSQVILDNTVSLSSPQNQNFVFGTVTANKDIREANVNATKNDNVEVKSNNAINKPTDSKFPAVTANQAAGFNFELKDTVSTKTLTTPVFPFTLTATTNTDTSNKQIDNKFGGTTINESFNVPSVGPFAINRDETKHVSALSSNVLGQSTTSTTQTGSTFTTSLSTKTSTLNFVTSVPTSKPTLFSFDSRNQSTTASSSHLIPSPFTTGSVQTTASSATSPFDNSSKGFVTSSSSTSFFPENVSKLSSPSNFFFAGSDNSFTKSSSSSSENLDSKSTFGQIPTTSTNFGINGSNTLSTNEIVRTTANNIFANTNSFATSSGLSAFNPTTKTNFSSNNFGVNRISNSNSVLNNDKQNTTPSFGPPLFSNPFGGTSGSTTTEQPSNFNSGRAFGQANSITSVSSFEASSPFEKKSVGPSTTETTPFGGSNVAFGSTSFTTPQNPQNNNVFTFGTNKPSVFSFGTNEPLKAPFNFQPETNANIFGNKDLGANASSGFNSSTSSQFGVQPAGGNMFNIGVGTSTPNRLRAQHKMKRRT